MFLVSCTVATVKICAYTDTNRPIGQCRQAAREMATLSLCSNVKYCSTRLSEPIWQKTVTLPLALREASLRSLSGEQRYRSAQTGTIENSYRASRFARGSVAQLLSVMAMFLLHLNVDICVRGSCLAATHTAQLACKHEVLCASQHWMHLHDHHAFCTRPHRCDQSDVLRHKMTLEKYTTIIP